MAQTRPTVKVDHTARVIAFDNEAEAVEERDTWERDTPQTARIRSVKGVFNVIVTDRKGVDKVMHEFVNWGGPVIKRYQARKQALEQGFTDDDLQYILWTREAVEPPEDPAFHRQFAMEAQAIFIGRPSEVQL